MTTTPDPTVSIDPNPLVSLFRQCVVRISDENGKFRGTGFFAAPGRLVTCAHVVHGAGALRVHWRDQDAAAATDAAVPPLDTVMNPADYPLPDLAVLSAGDAVAWGHPCVAVASGAPVLDGAAGLYLAGYTIEHGSGTALTGATTRFESRVEEDGQELLKLKHGLILPGFSGSPLLDLAAGAVAGIVESSRGQHTELGGFAVPASALAAAFSELFEENRAFHAHDRRWAKAADAERVQARERDRQRPGLPLLRPVVALPPEEGLSAAMVLRPRYAFVGYVGRERLLADIAAWCEQPPHAAEADLQAWFVTGGGGFGKTRLAVEACREAEARGWTAGLLSPDADDRDLDSLAGWPGRLLIAVDYAETRPALVSRLAAKLAASTPRPPTRILLLVRRRAAREDLLRWFNDQHEEELDALLRGAPVSRLDEADTEVSRLELYRQAYADFGRLPGMPGAGSSGPPRLRAPHFDRPLYVLAAAYLRRAVPGTDVDVLTEDDLLRVLLREHEAGHWMRWDQRRHLELDPEDQRSAVALATLLTGEGNDEALTVTRLIPHHAAEPETRLMAIARWLAQLYPAPVPAADNRLVIAPIEPDRLGEVLTADILAEHPGLLAAATDAASNRQLSRLLTITSRIASATSDIRGQLREILDQRLSDLLERGFQAGDGDLLTATMNAALASQPTRGATEAADRFPLTLPVALRPMAATITEIAVDGLRDLSAEREVRPELARMLGNLSVRLAEAGRRGEALDTSAEALTIRRQLAQASPAAYLPDLAASLSNHALDLAEAGRRGEALHASAEALTIRRQLAQASPAAYLPDLAASLSNHAVRLAEAGRREEALHASAEALTIRRQLAQASPAAYLPDLAASLNNHANLMAQAGESAMADELFDEVIGSLAAGAPGISHVLIARARWRLGRDRPGDAICDLLSALRATSDAGDHGARGETRVLLRELRQNDHEAFDQAWTLYAGPLPAWLCYLDPGEPLQQVIIAWVQTADWPASLAWFRDNAGVMLTDEAEAGLEHLIDINPGNASLRYHLSLLQNARADGLGAAYAAREEQEQLRQRAWLINSWITTPTWAESRDFAMANADALVDPATRAVLDAIGSTDPGNRDTRLHRGLLGYSATTGFEAAYGLLADAARQVNLSTDPATSRDDRLHLARMRSGLAGDDAEAHFHLAVTALAASTPNEADAALADCADNAAPYEKRDFARRLTELASGDPALTAALPQLLHILDHS